MSKTAEIHVGHQSVKVLRDSGEWEIVCTCRLTGDGVEFDEGRVVSLADANYTVKEGSR